ncbi:coproporphyrinogen III oxidase [Aeromicrobium camelliae]|uniref:Heme chaperone HemW n=1 Tax=Aeromicrobium camelliae TaxID=1538144 RepID=A0A3N6X878_9ACTN|nr:coproporphyrinogen III oxidase [Aeromicrobium camelliae]
MLLPAARLARVTAEGATAREWGRSFGLYLHVPFCDVRCGYCDFNTYTSDELGEGATRAQYADSALAEIALAREAVGQRRVDTVFVGGGTPTQLASSELVRMLRGIEDAFGFAPDVEVTTEANPDSVTPASLAELRDGGFTRISFGMQSAVPHVLAMLDRTHDPAGVPQAVRWAREAGFDQVSVDLIYGTPTESVDDWRRTVEDALAMEPDHISAYALIVEQGTAFARKVNRGQVTMPDDDETADKYVLADDLFAQAGLQWYELSNWARDDAARCRHNLGYWYSGDWWGIGPGAHSHVAGERWWNVKHPAAYAQRVSAGASPRMDGERLDDASRRLEDVMLRIRLREGIERSALAGDPEPLIAQGLLEPRGDRVVLTLDGRLLADHVVRELT